MPRHSHTLVHPAGPRSIEDEKSDLLTRVRRWSVPESNKRSSNPLSATNPVVVPTLETPPDAERV